MKPETWTTSDGRKISVREMGDEHLLNTLTLLENNPSLYERRADEYLALLEEAKWRKLR